MATTVSFNGSSYSVPAYNDIGWAQGPGNLSSYLVAIATGTLQTTGGTFTLSANINFGGSFGIIAQYFTTHSASPATSGVLRLATGDAIKWGASNLALALSGSILQFNSVNLLTAGTLTAGSVLFASAAALAAQDNSNFFWDSTNHRLGIGTTSPGVPLHIFSSSGNPVATVESTGAGNVAGMTLKTNSGSGQKEWALSNRGTSESPNNRLAFFYDGSEKFTVNSDGTLSGVAGVLGAASSWTPSFAGFSVNPTVSTAKYILIGKACLVYFITNVAGTSNATNFTITLPFAAKSSNQSIMLSLVEDNGAFQTGAGVGVTTASSTTLALFKDVGQVNGWTNTGQKRADFSGWYEIA